MKPSEIFDTLVNRVCEEFEIRYESVLNDAKIQTVVDARILLLSGEMNSGFTYSNTAKGLSVMVITKTTSADEFQDTFDHEKGHLAAHIALAEKVNPWGEEIEYLRGEIGKQTFKKAKHLLCEHCRK